MTDAPLTRRELRERERAAAAGRAAEAAKAASRQGADEVAPVAVRGPIASDAPAAPDAAALAEHFLTRRERRERERLAAVEGGEADDVAPAAAESADPAPASDAAPLPAVSSGPPAAQGGQAAPWPLFPEVAAPRADAGESVLQWNPRAGAEDGPRRSRASFGLPAEADQPLPVVRDPRLAPPAGADAAEIDDYFERLVGAAPSQPPTAGIIMPGSFDLDRTDGLSAAQAAALPAPSARGDRAIAAGAVGGSRPDTLHRSGDPEDEGIDDPVGAGGFAPTPARAAVSAGIATGFEAPEGPTECGIHVRSTADLPADSLAREVTAQPAPGRRWRPAESGDADDPERHGLLAGISAGWAGLGAAVVGAGVLVWGIIQGWFS